MATTIQDNVNNYYFKNQADFEAYKDEIPNNSTIYIEETGEVNVEINGTKTENVENLTNIVVGDKTYKVSTPTIDSELSETSENAVQNKVINSKITELNTNISNKQETLVSGTNIRTINGVNILSEGDLSTEPLKIELTGASGTLNDSDYNKTIINSTYINIGTELFYLGTLTDTQLIYYSNNKKLTLTKDTKAWVVEDNPSGGTTYTAGNGLTLVGTEFSADTNVLATKEDIPTGEIDINFNGTATATTENLNNIVVGDTTYNIKVTSDQITNNSVTNEKLDASLLNTVNNSLQKPTTAPTATELVGIDTNKSQVNIGIGDGLSLENGTLKASGGSGGNTIFYNKLEISTTTNLKSTLYFVSNTQNFSNLEDFINFVKNKKYLQVTGIIADADFTFYVSSIIVNSNTLIINYLQDNETNYYEFTADEISNFTSLSQQI